MTWLIAWLGGWFVGYWLRGVYMYSLRLHVRLLAPWVTFICHGEISLIDCVEVSASVGFRADTRKQRAWHLHLVLLWVLQRDICTSPYWNRAMYSFEIWFLENIARNAYLPKTRDRSSTLTSTIIYIFPLNHHHKSTDWIRYYYSTSRSEQIFTVFDPTYSTCYAKFYL